MTHYTERNIVCPAYRLLYFHVPKTACTSMKYVMARMNGQIPWGPLVDRTLILDRHSRRFRDYWHHHVHFVVPHPCVPRSEILAGRYDEFVKFGFFRNPWSRLYSCFRNKILDQPITDQEYVRGVTKGFVRYGFYCGMPFHEFADRVCGIPDDQASSHFGSQTHYVGVDIVQRLDFVGRMEQVGDDFVRLCTLARIPAGRFRLPHLTATATKDAYRAAYSDDLRRRVERRFEQDLSLLKYAF